MKEFFYVILILLLCNACSKKDPLEAFLLPGGGERPRVLASYPTDGLTGLDGTQGIWVLFDQNMDQQKTESAFSLAGPRGNTTGAFRWEGTRLIFLPKASLGGPDQLTLNVGRAAEAASGVNLEEDYLVRFFATPDTTRPAFLSSTPTNGSTSVGQNQSITLSFSKPIDFSSLASGITISPAIVSTITQNPNKDTVIITPASNLTNGTTYTVNITTNLKDLNGNALLQPITVAFVVGTTFAPPAVATVTDGVPLMSGVLTTGIDRTNPIVIQFSQPMHIFTTESAVTLSPPASTTRSWNATFDQLTLTFSPALDPETNYTLSIGNTATDANGNLLSTSSSFPFYTNSPTSVRPLVTQTRQESSATPGVCAGASGTGIYSALTNFSVLDTAMQIDGDLSPTQLCLINVRVDFNNAMQRNSLVFSTSFNRIFDASAGSVAIYNVITPGPTSGNYMIVQLYGNPWPTTPGIPTYQLLIRSGPAGVVDVNGNTMQSDYAIYLTF